MLVSVISIGTAELVFVPLLDEVTKRVYSIGNERVLVAHYGNRLRISKLSTALFFCALRNLQRTLRMQR